MRLLRSVWLASFLSSLIMFIDRAAINFAPLAAWDVERAGQWIVFHSVIFFCCCLEGGNAAVSSHNLRVSINSGKGINDLNSELVRALTRQLRVILTFSGVAIVVYGACRHAGFSLFFGGGGGGVFLDLSIFVSLVSYVSFYYLTQLQSCIMRALDGGALGYNSVNVAKIFEVALVLTVPFFSSSIHLLAQCLAFSRAASFLLIAVAFGVFFKKRWNERYSASIRVNNNVAGDVLSKGAGREYAVLALWPGVSASFPIIFLNNALGPHSVVLFSIHRLFSRLFVIVSQMIGRVAWAEKLNGRSLDWVESPQGTERVRIAMLLWAFFVLFVLATHHLLPVQLDVVGGVFDVGLIILFLILGLLQARVEILVPVRAAEGRLSGVLYYRLALFLVACIIGVWILRDVLALVALILVSEAVVLLRLISSNKR